jgi:hypothetical protein
VAKSVADQHIQDVCDETCWDLGCRRLGVKIHHDSTVFAGELVVPAVFDLTHHRAYGMGEVDRALIWAQLRQGPGTRRVSLVGGIGAEGTMILDRQRQPADYVVVPSCDPVNLTKGAQLGAGLQITVGTPPGHS